MKEGIYVINWTRQKGKMTKTGTTHVVCEGVSSALTTFIHLYPDREVESIEKAGEDVVVSGRELLL
jgi:hypothetical protein